MPRLPKLDPDALTPKQQQVFDAITNGPRDGVRDPFAALLHHPGVAEHVQAMGIHLRFNGVLPGRLRELAIFDRSTFLGRRIRMELPCPDRRKGRTGSGRYRRHRRKPDAGFPK